MKCRFAFPLAFLLALPALAQGVDPAALYEVTTAGSTTALKAKEDGKFVLAIKPKPSAHVSAEAPLKLELTGKNVTLSKEKFTLEDSVSKPAPGEQYAASQFEVPFTAEKPGQGSVDAKLTFFICTEKICSRQQKALSVPVHVTK